MYQFRPPFAFLNLSKLVKTCQFHTCWTRPVLTVWPQHTETSGTSTVFSDFQWKFIPRFFLMEYLYIFIKSSTKISSYFFIIKHIKVQEFPHQNDKRNMNDLLSFDHAKREWAVTKIYGNYKNDWFQSALWRKSQKNDSKNIFMLG